MKTLYFRLIILFVWAPLTINAQISPIAVKKYPAFICSKILEITTAVPLSTETQLKLGNYFLRMDQLAAEALKTEAYNTIPSFYKMKIADLEKILTPIELNDYTVTIQPSRISIAIKNRIAISLSEGQITQLLKSRGKLKELNGTPNFDSVRFENEQLLQTLTLSQVKDALGIINKSKALYYANADLSNLRKFNTAQNIDSIKTLTTFFDYQLRKINDLDIISVTGTQLKIDSVKNYFERIKPDILIMLAGLKGTVTRSQFSDLLKYRTELSLNSVQVDTILNKIVELEHLRNDYKQNFSSSNYYAKPFENQNLIKILDSKQLTAYLRIKNLAAAIDKAKSSWASLKQYSLTQGVDSVATFHEIQEYHLNVLASSDLVAIDKSQKNAFLKKSIENRKPLILIKLDEETKGLAAKNATNKSLEW